MKMKAQFIKMYGIQHFTFMALSTYIRKKNKAINSLNSHLMKLENVEKQTKNAES